MKMKTRFPFAVAVVSLLFAQCTHHDRGAERDSSRYNNPDTGDYPVGHPTSERNQVISPYSPYNIIDVRGYHPGQLVRDPSNNEIFRVPLPRDGTLSGDK